MECSSAETSANSKRSWSCSHNSWVLWAAMEHAGPSAGIRAVEMGVVVAGPSAAARVRLRLGRHHRSQDCRCHPMARRWVRGDADGDPSCVLDLAYPRNSPIAGLTSRRVAGGGGRSHSFVSSLSAVCVSRVELVGSSSRRMVTRAGCRIGRTGASDRTRLGVAVDLLGA